MTLLLKTQKIPKILCVITKTARSLDALFAKRGRKICWENGLLLRSLSKTKVPFKGFFCPLHLHFPLEICCNAYVISSVKDQQKKGLDFCGQNYKLVFVLETRKLFWFGLVLLYFLPERVSIQARANAKNKDKRRPNSSLLRQASYCFWQATRLAKRC